ncbi:hypothetical protein BS47DRAFT_1481513 [Hydnum rufescens UP504]|uniref:RRM domain-containing protein n=1 Tax=Hydnum rufescens UP504 TaxID=1448309 RepID=A0A9P6E202_9AGAM|nr:hypothetical protein BS47DRAFT_1481513 [Hydnum rufescens UP504]
MSAEPVSAPDALAPAQEAAQELGHKVFAGNLAYATTDEGLRAFFALVAGDILSVQVIQRGTRSAGYGFVSLSSKTAVDKAVSELNKKELDGRTVIIEAAKPAEDKDKERAEKRSKKRAGRRGSKAPLGEVTEAEANGEVPEKPVEPAASTEEEKPKKAKKTRKPRPKKAATNGEANASTPAPSETAKKPAKRPRAPKPPRPEGEAPTGEPSKSVVFVANLAFNVDDAALAELFTSAGINVVSARVVRRRFGQPRRSKGYGFVDVGNEEQQKKAVQLFEGKELAGREIAVKIAVSAPPADSEGVTGAPLTEEALAKKAEAEGGPTGALAH